MDTSLMDLVDDHLMIRSACIDLLHDNGYQQCKQQDFGMIRGSRYRIPKTSCIPQPGFSNLFLVSRNGSRAYYWRYLPNDATITIKMWPIIGHAITCVFKLCDPDCFDKILNFVGVADGNRRFSFTVE